LSVQKIGHYLLKTKRVILGGSSSTGAKPPGLKIKEAMNLRTSLRGPSLLAKVDFKSLIPASGR